MKNSTDPKATNKTIRLAQLHAYTEASKLTAQITRSQRQLTIINTKEKVAFR